MRDSASRHQPAAAAAASSNQQAQVISSNYSQSIRLSDLAQALSAQIFHKQQIQILLYGCAFFVGNAQVRDVEDALAQAVDLKGVKRSVFETFVSLLNQDDFFLPVNLNLYIHVAELVKLIITRCDINKILDLLAPQTTREDWPPNKGMVYLMSGLSRASYNNNVGFMIQILEVVQALFGQCVTNDSATKLLAGLLAENKEINTGFTFLSFTLKEVSKHNNTKFTMQLATAIYQLVSLCDKFGLAEMLVRGMTQNVNLMHEIKGVTTLTYLIRALYYATNNRNTSCVLKIGETVGKLFQVSNRPELAKHLLESLFVKVKHDQLVTTTAFSHLAHSLTNTHYRDVNATQIISAVIGVLFELCSINNLSVQLFQGMTESMPFHKATGGTGLSCIMYALHRVMVHPPQLVHNKVKQAIYLCVCQLIIALDDVQIPEKIKSEFMFHKDAIKHSLIHYLENISDAEVLRRITNKKTVLGQLIDYNTSWWRSEDHVTETRKDVTTLIAKKSKQPANASTVSVSESRMHLIWENLTGDNTTNEESPLEMQTLPLKDVK